MNSIERRPPDAVSWVLLPACVMSLGWGLRGYIGGGPFGAMIPGALVALLLCQNLGWRARHAAAVVAFGAFGIGFGGEMTYGQTLGLFRENSTFVWALVGTTLKGAVWGLLGGAVLGLGFAVREVSQRQLILALACLLAGTIAGLQFINEPRILYFSDPVNRPRDESWAGFLVGGLALLAYCQVFAPKAASVASTFALYGSIGGGIGFGAGSLLLALQFHVPQAWRWLPYWKFMEFSFGLVFGAALGLCALRMRDQLSTLNSREQASIESTKPQGRWLTSVIVGTLISLGVFYAWPPVVERMDTWLANSVPAGLFPTVSRVVLGFIGMGCLLLVFARQSRSIAWQAAISVAIVAAAIDWERDLLPRGNIDLSQLSRNLFVLVWGAISIVVVASWQTKSRATLANLYLFAVCVFMGFGYLMGLSRADIWSLDATELAAEGGRLHYYWNAHRSEILVHTIFTLLFLTSLVPVYRFYRPPRDVDFAS